MILSRMLPFAALILVAAVARGDQPEPVTAPKAGGPERADVPREEITPADRGRARAEFVSARKEFAEMLVAGLTSEALAEEAREVSARFRLRRAGDRLAEVRNRLDEVKEAGRAETEEAERLRERQKALEVEIDVLRSPEAEASSGETGKLAAQLVAERLRTAMAEETEYLADVLDTGELRERTRRLRRLMALARIVGGLAALREEPADGEGPVVPAGGTAETKESGAEPPEGSLGEETTEPPATLEDAGTPSDPEG